MGERNKSEAEAGSSGSGQVGGACTSNMRISACGVN